MKKYPWLCLAVLFSLLISTAFAEETPPLTLILEVPVPASGHVTHLPTDGYAVLGTETVPMTNAGNTTRTLYVLSASGALQWQHTLRTMPEEETGIWTDTLRVFSTHLTVDSVSAADPR